MLDRSVSHPRHMALNALVACGLLAACDPGESASAPEQLLDIPVDSFENVAAEEVNTRIAALDSSREEYADPLFVLSRVWSRHRAASQAFTVTRVDSAQHESYHATVIFDALPEDDSISGWRYELVLTKNDASLWTAAQIKRSWRCWEGRGHRSFSTKPCT